MKISREGSLSDTEKQKGLPSTEKQDEDYDSMSYTKNKRDEYLLAIRKKKIKPIYVINAGVYIIHGTIHIVRRNKKH